MAKEQNKLTKEYILSRVESDFEGCLSEEEFQRRCSPFENDPEVERVSEGVIGWLRDIYKEDSKMKFADPVLLEQAFEEVKQMSACYGGNINIDFKGLAAKSKEAKKQLKK